MLSNVVTRRAFPDRDDGPGINRIGYLHEAMYYEKLDDDTVKCGLCPHGCVLKNGSRGFCRVREPNGGKLFALSYGLVCAAHVDPIEKKPIYHMMPGSKSFSIATAGCNLRCKFCQNWQISQSPPEDTSNEYMSATKIIGLAKDNGCRSVAYTYSEPTVFYEYMLDSSKLAKSRNLKNIYVTAGYIQPEPLVELCKFMDAANVDLKGYDDNYLKNMSAQRLKPLLEAIKIMHDEGVWIEITNLIVPTMNDDMGMIKDMCVWIRENAGKDTPLHFSRFWPMYKLTNLPPTPLETLILARETALNEGLNYVYIGNAEARDANNTFCPKCGRAVIERAGYFIKKYNIKSSKCAFCGYPISGIWEE